MQQEIIFKEIKTAFCGLMNYKIRGETIEILTPFCTLNNKFISLFISQKDDKFIISDGGWIESKMYDVEYDEFGEGPLSKIYYDLEKTYHIQTVKDKKDLKYYYKVSSNIQSLSSDVFDMGNFVLSLVNSYTHNFSEKGAREERVRFKRQADDFLKAQYKGELQTRQSIDDIKFNAIITKNRSQLTLINYVTGTNLFNFNAEINRCIVNFELAENSKYRSNIVNMFTIINDQASGFDPIRQKKYLDLLNKKLTKNFYTWTRRQEILKAV